MDHTPDVATFEMTCGKGTYVRALAVDLAAALGTVGHVSLLRRTAVGPFREAEAVALDALEAAEDRDALLRPLVDRARRVSRNSGSTRHRSRRSATATPCS